MVRKYTFFVWLVLGITNILGAQHIHPEEAKRIAFKFFAAKASQVCSTTLPPLHLIKTIVGQHPTDTLCYLFNIEPAGFIIVSADDRTNAIWAYSTTNKIKADLTIPAFDDWIKQLALPTQSNQTIPGNNVTALVETFQKNATDVAPLLTTQWNQDLYYNENCPPYTPVGCVATAMAQVMKYWNYPNKGNDYHSYSHPTYGMLSANFGNTQYRWNQMPDALTSPNTAVSLLLFHAGVSVEMNYQFGGSSAYLLASKSNNRSSAEQALKTYFGYKNSLQGIERKYYTDSEWVTILKSELDEGRPVLYGAMGNGGGHSFIIDGYDSLNFFHINWGWGGLADGYYALNQLNPLVIGTGGGSGNYHSDHQALIGIEPANQSNTFVSETSMPNIGVYPNPNNGLFSVTLPANQNTAELTFRNSLGTIVHQVKMEQPSIKIDFTGQPTGLYFIEWVCPTQKYTCSFLYNPTD